MKVLLVVIAFFGLYVILNFGRVATKRLNQIYLKHAWKRTLGVLLLFQLEAILIFWLSRRLAVEPRQFFYIVAFGQLLATILIYISTKTNIKTASLAASQSDNPQSQMPAVTVCIPARNETADLEECLNSLLESTFQKLEILVLDDSSQTRRTPEIIRSFAHEGVRFLAGRTPPSSWLPKNYAYDQMAVEANGDILLFCGVDCRFEPQTISNLVELALAEKTTMISLLPKNVYQGTPNLRKYLAQPIRYCWELALPRRYFRRPPVLSTCWMIQKDSLKKYGGFDSVKRKAVPESYFAQVMAKERSYKFVISSDSLGLTSHKTYAEQKATAIRNRYPQLHRRPENVALMSFIEIVILIGPVFLLLGSFISGELLLGLIGLTSASINCLNYKIVTDLTYRQNNLTGFFMQPVAAIYDIFLLNFSMWQYEFGLVEWKGRDISKPIIEVIPNLPKLD